MTHFNPTTFKDPHLQIQPHPEVWVSVSASTYEHWEDIIQPITVLKEEMNGKMLSKHETKWYSLNNAQECILEHVIPCVETTLRPGIHAMQTERQVQQFSVLLDNCTFTDRKSLSQALVLENTSKQPKQTT